MNSPIDRAQRLLTTSYEPSKRVNTPLPDGPESATEFSARDILFLVRRRIGLIIFCGLIAMLIAIPVLLSIPKEYYAETRIMLDRSPALALAADPSGTDVDINPAVEIERLRSEAIINAIIERFDLEARPEFNVKLQEKTLMARGIEALELIVSDLLGRPVVPDEPEPNVSDRVRAKVLSQLSIDRSGITSVITIGFTAQDPLLSAAVPKAVVDIYAQQDADRWMSSIDTAMVWLDARIGNAEERLAISRRELERVRSGAPGERAQTMEGRLRLLAEREAAISSARTEVEMARASVAAARSTPGMTALSEPARLSQLRAELEKARLYKVSLSPRYSENYPPLFETTQKMERLEAEIAQELARYDQTLALRENALQREAARLSETSDALLAEIGAHKLHAADLDRLTAIEQEAEKTVSDLQLRAERLRSEGMVTPVSLQVLRPASEPIYPLGHSRKLLLVVVLMGGLFIGLVLATTVELCDGTLRGFDQIVHKTRFNPLGLLLKANAKKCEEALIALRDRRPDPLADATRDAVFLLEQANGGSVPRIFSVATADNSARTVPVARLFAEALAAKEINVWLVDTGQGTDPWQEYGQRIECCALGEYIEHAATLREALNEVREHALADGAVVIVDAPPLHTTESLEIASVAEQVVLVARWGHTSRRLIDLTDRLLERIGAVSAHMLITDVRPKRHRLYGFNDRTTVAGAHK